MGPAHGGAAVAAENAAPPAQIITIATVPRLSGVATHSVGVSMAAISFPDQSKQYVRSLSVTQNDLQSLARIRAALRNTKMGFRWNDVASADLAEEVGGVYREPVSLIVARALRMVNGLSLTQRRLTQHWILSGDLVVGMHFPHSLAKVCRHNLVQRVLLCAVLFQRGGGVECGATAQLLLVLMPRILTSECLLLSQAHKRLFPPKQDQMRFVILTENAIFLAR